MTDLFISVGEASGDRLGAALIDQILNLHPQCEIGAVAGPLMRAQKIAPFFQMENLQVMGFIDVLFALPKIIRQFFAIRNQILKLNPKGVVCIDYPGFHLRLEKSLRRKGYQGKLIHFVCPTVWAWGKKRIKLMTETLDLLLALFPFEPACFSHTQLPVRYVGHPLSSTIVPSHRERKKILALFPGSRKKEVERNLPIQIQIARKLASLDRDLQIIVSAAHPNLKPLIETLAPSIPIARSNENLMQEAHLAIATSGTVTLELALHETPTIVNFAIRPIDLFLAQKIFRIDLPFYALPNIVLSKRVFPELFGPNLTPEQLFFWAEKLWFDSTARSECEASCRALRQSMGSTQASEEAARQILKIIYNKLF